MTATVPLLNLIFVNQAQISFVDERGGLECLPWRFLGHFRRRQFAQLIVDERQKLLGSMRIALLNGGQDASDFGHEVDDRRLGERVQAGLRA